MTKGHYHGDVFDRDSRVAGTDGAGPVLRPAAGLSSGGEVAAKESETDDFLALLIKWRMLTLLAVLSGAGLGLAWSFFSTPLYEARALLQVGTVKANVLIEPPENLAERIKERSRAADKADSAFLKEARVSRSAKAMVTFVAYGRSEEQAKDLLGRVLESLIDEHEVLLNEALESTKQRLLSLQQQIVDMRGQADILLRRVNQLSARDVGASLVIVSERGELLREIARLDQQRYELMLSLAEAKPSVIVAPPVSSSDPAVPQRALYALTGALAGLLLSIALVVVLNRRRGTGGQAVRYGARPN